MRAAAAAFVGGLEDESAFGHGRRGGVSGDLPFERGEQVVNAGGGFEGFLGVAGEFLVGAFGEPFGAVFAGDGKEGVDGDGVGGGDAAFLGLAFDSDGWAGGDFEAEAHHGLVNAADFLHVQGAVAEALAVEDEEVVQDAEESAVAD